MTESAADPGCRCLVAAGGDGTVAALVNECPGVPISVLPTGTENLFARHFGLSREPRRLAATIAGGRVSHLDLGVTGDRRFALMAGIGFDADVVTRHHTARVGLAGVPRPTHRGRMSSRSSDRASNTDSLPFRVSIADPGREETLVGSTAFRSTFPATPSASPLPPRPEATTAG